MRKILIGALLMIPFMAVSCFEFVGTGTAKRTLQLALVAPGDVARLHIAVFDGLATQDKLIYRETAAAGSSIPLDLPAGDNRIIVVWAEGFSGNANYFGSIGPITITEGGNTPLPIRMVRFDNNAASFNVAWNTTSNLFTWNSIPGANTYEITFYNYMTYTTINAIAIGNTYRHSTLVSSPTNIHLRVLTSVFDIGSDWSN